MPDPSAEPLFTTIEDATAAYLSERDLCDRLAAELARWGWGDFHYGPQPQERSVATLVGEYRLRRALDA